MDSTQEFEQLDKRVERLESKITLLEAQLKTLTRNDKQTSNAWSVEATKNEAKQNWRERQAAMVAESNKATSETQQPSNDVESKIGKNIMSILASILVFCSLVIFGSMIHSIMTPMAKTVIMLVGSIGLAALGIVKMKKDGKYKTLFTSLAACGVGAFYISCLVAYFSLETIGMVSLAIAIGLWIVAVTVLCRYSSRIFTYICFTGILVATFLSGMQWSSSLIAFCLYAVCVSALYSVSHSCDYKKDWWMFVQYPIVCLLVIEQLKGYVSTTSALVIATCIGVLLLQMFRYNIKKGDEKLLSVSVFFGILACLSGANHIYDLLFVPIALGLCGLVCVRYRKEMPAVFYTAVFTSAIATLTQDYGDFYNDYLLFLAIPVLLVGVGCALKEMPLRMAGYALLLGNLLCDMSICKFYPIIVAALAIIWLINNYYAADKYAITALTTISVLHYHSCGWIDMCTMFIIMGVISLAINTKMYRTNHIRKETELASKIISMSFNALMMIVGLSVITNFRDNLTIGSEIEGSTVVGISLASLVLLALSVVNIRTMYNDKENEELYTIITCMKLTLVVGTIINRMSDINYLMSIVGLIMAVGFVVAGFKYKRKLARIYGLILSMICVVKLVIFDIKYDSSLMRPLGFLIAGALCYLISYIYSRLEKNNKKEEAPIEQ